MGIPYLNELNGKTGDGAEGITRDLWTHKVQILSPDGLRVQEWRHCLELAEMFNLWVSEEKTPVGTQGTERANSYSAKGV